VNARYDVVVLGGGLAGLCLALQLRQQQPGVSVLVVEKKPHPVPEAAHKVGESSVEIGAHYFTQVLGQLEHFRAAQLPKMGLRYFFAGDRADVAKRTELGGHVFFPTESFQIDRGRFENHLGQEVVRAGADFVHGAAVREVTLGQPHRVTIAGEVDTVVEARWVIDASGRASLLKRKLGLAKRNGHDANSVWWRYDRHVKVDDWSDDAAWHAHVENKRRRWLSTVHFMGEGYWVWLIPLASGSHSVGIVADGTIHPYATMSSYEKAMQWLRDHEPQVAAVCEGREDQLQDFLGLKGFSYSCTQLFSPDRWALVGEAGAFLDPFYSPGSDYIAMANTLAAELVRKDLAGERIGATADIYNRVFFKFYDNHLSLYEGQMKLFGDTKPMTLKVVWDWAYYWVLPAAFFFSGRLTDAMTFARFREQLDRSGELNRRVQALFRAWHDARVEVEPVFVDIPGIPCLYELNRQLRDELPGDAFEKRLLANLALLERLAGELAGEARRDDPAIDLGGIDPVDEVELLASVFPLLRRKAS
jgi:flavin-dependent dehydrogenase